MRCIKLEFKSVLIYSFLNDFPSKKRMFGTQLESVYLKITNLFRCAEHALATDRKNNVQPKSSLILLPFTKIQRA